MSKISILVLMLSTMLFTSCNFTNEGLTNALSSGNLERVKEAVDNGADIHYASILLGPDAVPLYYAMRNSDKSISEYLLSQGADPNFIDSDGISLLMYTVGANKESGLQYSNMEWNENYKLLLNNDRTDINLRGKLGYAALDYACLDNGNMNIVSYLINHGADITTITMKCALEGFIEGSCEASVVKVIFDSIKNQGISYGIGDEYVAALEGDTERLVTLWVNDEIDEVNINTIMFMSAAFGDLQALQTLEKPDFDLNQKFNGSTLLATACSYGKLCTVEYLINRGVNLELRSVQNDYIREETSLTKTVRHNRIEIVECLLESGAEFEIHENTTQDNNLSLACENGNLEIVKLLIDNAYPLTDYQLTHALSAAASYNHINILEYFFDVLEVDINIESFDNTILGESAWKADIETIQYLVDYGADINGSKSRVGAPLYFAVIFNKVDIAEYLIKQGADVNIIGTYTNSGGKTTSLLVKAVQDGYFDMVRLLVENGANVNYEEEWSSGNATALDVAEKEGSKNIIEYLKSVQID